METSIDSSMNDAALSPDEAQHTITPILQEKNSRIPKYPQVSQENSLLSQLVFHTIVYSQYLNILVSLYSIRTFRRLSRSGFLPQVWNFVTYAPMAIPYFVIK
ncbi:hypothetical protein QC760_000499 [Botrytis cinerea]